jgi:hypothetical protein
MKRAKENNEDTANRHAAQIFAEMLGQVCRPELYNLKNEYQESFVVHIRHCQNNFILCQIAKPLSLTDLSTRR